MGLEAESQAVGLMPKAVGLALYWEGMNSKSVGPACRLGPWRLVWQSGLKAGSINADLVTSAVRTRLMLGQAQT